MHNITATTQIVRVESTVNRESSATVDAQDSAALGLAPEYHEGVCVCMGVYECMGVCVRVCSDGDGVMM